MIARIIGFIVGVMCAVPMLIVAHYGKDSVQPISINSGDDKMVKSKVKNVREYNKEMAAVYKKYGFSFILAGVGYLITPVVGITLLILDCTVGIYIYYRKCKSILKKYS